MINELKDAIIKKLDEIEGVECKEYAGQLEDQPVGSIRTPGILIHFGEIKVSDSSGFDSSFEMQQQISAFVIAKHARHVNDRAKSVDALVENVLPRIHNQNFIEGAGIAKVTKVVPNFMLERQGASVREIRWSQDIILGESEWDGDVVSEVIFNDDVLLPGEESV